MHYIFALITVHAFTLSAILRGSVQYVHRR